MSDDLRRRLEEAGRRPAPSPDPAFADDLETRLVVVAGSLPPVPAGPPPRRRPAAWRLAAGVVGLSALVLVVAFAAGLLGPRPEPGPAPELAGPVNIEVALADGTILEDPDGLLLPEGAVVTVGAGGTGRIGDTVLEPGDVATVHGGRVEVTRPSPVAAVPTAAPGSTPRPAATSRPTASPPADTSRPTPSASTPPESPAPTPSLRPRSTSSPTPRPAATATSSIAPTPAPTPASLRPRLRARLVTGPRIAVRWTATWGADSYVLLASPSRSGPAADPALPGARVLGTFAVPPDRALRFRVPDGVVEVKLRVLALRADGTVLRRSRIVTITIPTDAAGDDARTPTPSPTPDPPSPDPTPSPSPTP